MLISRKFKKSIDQTVCISEQVTTKSAGAANRRIHFRSRDEAQTHFGREGRGKKSFWRVVDEEQRPHTQLGGRVSI